MVVLPDPVIPEFIVVHDGRPEDPSAPNYWIRFKPISSKTVLP